MRETRQVSRINIGTASIVLILIILCLSVFSLLSLSDARPSLLQREEPSLFRPSTAQTPRSRDGSRTSRDFPFRKRRPDGRVCPRTPLWRHPARRAY